MNEHAELFKPIRDIFLKTHDDSMVRTTTSHNTPAPFQVADLISVLKTGFCLYHPLLVDKMDHYWCGPFEVLDVISLNASHL